MSQSAALPQATADLKNAVYKRITLRLIPFIFICYLFNYLDRVNVGFAKLQMLDALKFSETVYGLGAGIFFIGYVLCGVPSNLALSRFGPRRWIALMMITWGTLSTCLLFITTPTGFYTLRLLTGAAEAGFFPGVVLYLSQWFPSFRRGRIMALFMSAIPVSGLLGSPFSGWILNHFAAGQGGLAGWQWMFLLQGIPTPARRHVRPCQMADRRGARSTGSRPGRRRGEQTQDRQRLARRSVQEPGDLGVRPDLLLYPERRLRDQFLAAIDHQEPRFQR